MPSAEASRRNGKLYGGRPKGGKNDAQAEVVRQRYADAGPALAAAKLQLALGCQRVYRVTGVGVVRVTDEEEIFQFLNGGAQAEGMRLVAAVDADIRAIDSAENRAFGKPRETMAVTGPDGEAVTVVLLMPAAKTNGHG